MKDLLGIRLNVIQVLSIESFANINGGINQGIKDVYFIRYIGFDDKYKFLDDINKIDENLTVRAKKHMGGYIRINELPKLISNDDIKTYKEFYKKWISSERKYGEIRYKFISNILHDKYWRSITRVENLFLKFYKCVNESIVKNFIIKILYWSDLVMPKLFENWSESISPKFILSGEINKQEYFFLYFLVLLGVDVLYLNTERDLYFEEELMSLSILNKGKMCEKVSIPDYSENILNINQEVYRNKDKSKTTFNKELNNPKIVINERQEVSTMIQIRDRAIAQREKKELGFEEIAKLASSIVMITVLNKEGDCIKSGSGIIISKEGYILTNYHVISGGYHYLVRIEDDDKIYDDYELIKYNYHQDLALIKINRVCKPILIYKGDKPLVRGQKVVAIGSPLGLFNSVSDGIISGFREFDNLNMIQFTAPISNGSSGGAVLNMYGEIIGISTAGFDKGQNINLAVDYRNILTFVRGFI